MGKLNRGNLLATLKKLKKMPRPKVVIANPAVQAICGGSSIKPNKKADLKAVIERRRALISGRGVPDSKNVEEFIRISDAEFESFCAMLQTHRKTAKHISNDISKSSKS